MAYIIEVQWCTNTMRWHAAIGGRLAAAHAHRGRPSVSESRGIDDTNHCIMSGRVSSDGSRWPTWANIPSNRTVVARWWKGWIANPATVPWNRFLAKRERYLMPRLLYQVTDAVRIADLNSLNSRGGGGGGEARFFIFVCLELGQISNSQSSLVFDMWWARYFSEERRSAQDLNSDLFDLWECIPILLIWVWNTPSSSRSMCFQWDFSFLFACLESLLPIGFFWFVMILIL